MNRARQIMNQLVDELNLRSFLEIGYANGNTHEEIKCERKVAVDPSPDYKHLMIFLKLILIILI